MRRALASAVLAIALGGGLVCGSVAPAEASVSIAVLFDPLVAASDVVAVVVPVETTSVWEEGRIYTYTRVKVESTVGGEVGGEAWIRTRGGVVGKVGQLVDGEAVFAKDKPSLVFLRKGASGTFDVNARAQGQFPVVLDDATKTRRLQRAANVGVLYPPKEILALQASPRPAAAGTSQATATTGASKTPVLAADMIHGRAVDEATRDIAVAWKRLHAR